MFHFRPSPRKNSANKRLRRAVACMEFLESRQLLDGVPGFTSADTTTVNAHTNFSFLVTTEGVLPMKLSEKGGLPSGVSFTDNGNGTATISGVPAGAGKNGVFDITIKATNSLSSATQLFELDVDQIPTFNSPPRAVINTVAGGTYTFKTTGGVPAPTFSAFGLPDHVSITSNGDGTGTLTVPPGGLVTPGYYADVNFDALTIIATTPAGSVSQDFSLTIDQAPAFIDPGSSSATITENSFSTMPILVTGFPDVNLSLKGTLPQGMSFQTRNGIGTLAGIGTLSGTPTQSGSFNLVFQASSLEVIGTPVKFAFTLNVDAPPGFTTLPSAIFAVGKSGSYSIKTEGFPPAALTKVGALPAGLTFTPNANGTAVLSGTPAAGTGGVYDFTVLADGGTASQSFALTVNQSPTITSSPAATFTAGSASIFTVTTTGFPTAQLSQSGSLPKGVSFVNQTDGTARIAGTPAATAGGKYNITISAKNAGATVTQKFTLTVAQAPAISGSTSLTIKENKPVNHTFNLTGFPTPISVGTITGLPPGVSLATNSNGTALILTGTPTATGPFTVDFLLSNADFTSGSAISASLTITVSA